MSNQDIDKLLKKGMLILQNDNCDGPYEKDFMMTPLRNHGLGIASFEEPAPVIYPAARRDA